MSSPPYMPFYFSDYFADTAHLTMEEHGAYFLLIANYWQTGKPLPDDDAILARICRTSLRKFKLTSTILKQFFENRDGLLYHPRIEVELQKVRQKSDKTRSSAKARWEKQSCERNANALPTQSGRNAISDIRYQITDIYNNNDNAHANLRTQPNPTDSLRQFCYDVLKSRNYGMDALISPQTGAMLSVWEAKGVQPADVTTGMDYADAKKGGSPRYPSYYKDCVLQAMQARLDAENEINNPGENHEPQQRIYQPKESSVHRVRRRLAELEAEELAEVAAAAASEAEFD